MAAGLGRYKISTRLGVGLGLIIAFLAVLTATGIWSLSTISGKLEQVINVNNTKSDLSRTIQNSIASINKSILATILANDSEVTKVESKKIEEARTAYKAALEKLEKLETSAKGKELIKNINDNLVQVKAANDETVEVMRAGMVREASTMVTGNMQTSGMLADACREMVEFQAAQTAIRAKESRATYFKALLFLLIIGAVVFAFAIFLASFLARSIAKPMSDGVTVAHRIAEGDLTTHIDTSATDETGQLLGAMKEMVTKLQQIIAQVKSAADKISSSSYNLNSSSEAMSVGASEQAARAAQVATASEEMSQTILDIAKNTSSIENSATAAAKLAKDGEEVMGRSVDKVKAIATTIDQSAQLTRSLGERSNQIGDIISVINDIADQTNLLALNAAIEAARAGDAGRGFAVVADEVKKLAERTGNSTSEIGGMIKAIQDEVRLAVVSMENIAEEVTAGVDLSSQAGEVLRSIVSSINELHAMVQQIASATEQMASTSDGINRDIESIASVSKGTLGDSEQVAKASHKLADLSIYLEKVVGGFKV